VEAKTGFSSNKCCCIPNKSLVNGFRACAHSEMAKTICSFQTLLQWL
jgi:hypothetical protein